MNAATGNPNPPSHISRAKALMQKICEKVDMRALGAAGEDDDGHETPLEDDHDDNENDVSTPGSGRGSRFKRGAPDLRSTSRNWLTRDRFKKSGTRKQCVQNGHICAAVGGLRWSG